MRFEVILIASLCIVFCLTPVCVYLGWLAAVNRRTRPTLISSVWDFVLLMFGLSGFILFGGALIIETLLDNDRIIPRGNWHQIREALDKERPVWFLLCGGYATLVLGYASVMLWSRRASFSIYNIADDQRLDEIISRIFERIGIQVKRFGNIWSSKFAVLSVKPFTALRHVNLTILVEDPELCAEIERELRGELAKTSWDANPAAVWFTSASFYVLLLIFLSLIALAIIVYS